MEHFGKLLRRMRGGRPVAALARRAKVSVAYWLDVEEGRERLREREARRLLRRSFGLQPAEVRRLILGLQLYDLGLRENYLRQLVIDLIQGVTPRRVREEVRKLYRRYAP